MTIARTGVQACAAYNKKGHTAYDTDCPYKIKIKKRTVKRLKEKIPFYGQHQQKIDRGSIRKSEETKRQKGATQETISTREKELSELKTSLRAIFEDYKKQGRQPNTIESTLIQTVLARIRALRKKTGREEYNP